MSFEAYNVLSLEEIEANFNKFCDYCAMLGDRAVSVRTVIDHFADRLAVCPASSRIKFHNAFPGGLVEHSLRVLKCANRIAKAMEFKVSKESLIISTLFHDFGKVGGLGEKDDFYLVQDSDWHREKLGQVYKVNEKLQFMPNADRTLFILQHFGVKLTEEEWLSIKLNDGPEAPENAPYNMKEPTLAVIVHMADRMACELEKLNAVSRG